MNWDHVGSNWAQSRADVKDQWGKLTDDQLDMIAGKRTRLVDEIRAAYGVSRHAAEWQLSGWLGRQIESATARTPSYFQSDSQHTLAAVQQHAAREKPDAGSVGYTGP